MNTKLYDEFEKTLQDGLVKVCQGAGFLREGLLESEDLENKWNDYIKDYIADAVANFNDYPEAALAWAGFLGMPGIRIGKSMAVILILFITESASGTIWMSTSSMSS